MSDIFLNFNFTDHKAATKLAAVFQQQGWTVWKGMSGYGAAFNATEERELREAKVSVVLWSRKASASIIFRATLEIEGQPAGVYVLLEEFYPRDLPRHALSFDLSDWDGAASHAELQRLVRTVGDEIYDASGRLSDEELSYIDKLKLPTPPTSLEGLSLSEIRENARRGIQESAGARPGDGTRFRGVFISYRRDEAAAYARGLYDRLAARFGRERVFFDMANVGWGEDFVESITSAAESCAVLIALISPRWLRGADAELDDYVRLEVAKALGRKIRVIPILIPGASMPAPKELPEDLAPLVRRNALAFSDTRWERDVEDLIKTLETLLKD
jgi:hypothetical protein